jgi:hypothetical protein
MTVMKIVELIGNSSVSWEESAGKRQLGTMYGEGKRR